jgi:pilus assembly protein CpaB
LGVVWRLSLSNKIKYILIVISGLVLLAVGVFASFLLIEYLQSNTGTPEEEEIVERTTVVVLSRDLSLGEAITAEDVTSISMPVEFVPENQVVTSVEEAVGKMIKTDLVQGEILLKHNLADPTNNNQDLSFVLSDDHVLMAFPATDMMSQERMVQRGDIVDIFVTFSQELTETDEEGEEIIITKSYTLDSMQNVSVTAMILEVVSEEQNTSLVESETPANSSPEGEINAYLLALNPQDALILKYLKDNGAIFDLVLRAPTSQDQFSLKPVSEEFIAEYYGLELNP